MMKLKKTGSACNRENQKTVFDRCSTSVISFLNPSPKKKRTRDRIVRRKVKEKKGGRTARKMK
jgi:hypothetical protein